MREPLAIMLLVCRQLCRGVESIFLICKRIVFKLKQGVKLVSENKSASNKWRKAIIGKECKCFLDDTRSPLIYDFPLVLL